MALTTSRGYPYPEATDGNDPPVDIQALAEKVDAAPGVSVLTTAARDALSGVELWNGRQVWNTTLGKQQQYDSTAGAWRDVSVRLTTASVAPTSPMTNDLWIDTA